MGTRGERTRAAILVAARDRLEREGYDGTTIARIAEDAGVAQPTVVFHFGSKAGLLVAVMQAYYADLLVAMDEVLRDEDRPRVRLAAFARWWLAHNARNLSLLSVFGRHGRRVEPDEVVTAFRECNRRVTREFDRLVEDLKHVGVVRETAPTRVLRDAFFGTAEHLLLGRATTGTPDDLDRSADDLVALLLDGAGATGDPEGDRLARVEAKIDRLLANADRAVGR